MDWRLYIETQNQTYVSGKKREHRCHRGQKVGDSFDFDTERGMLCPMAMHVAFPYIDILRYGRSVPTAHNEEIRFCCSYSDVINIFKIEREDSDDSKNN